MRRVLVLTAVLLAVLGPGPADAYRLKGARWQTRTITYYTETPAYAWSVDTAAYAWNTSGARVQFVKSSRARAKVLIGIRWYKRPAGDALVQRLGGRIMSAQVGIQTGHDRYEMALIVAHELGHVLGLDHALQVDDVGGAVKLYGGTVRPWRGSPFCN